MFALDCNTNNEQAPYNVCPSKYCSIWNRFEGSICWTSLSRYLNTCGKKREREKEGKIAQVCYDTGEICISSVGTHQNPRTVSLCTEVDIGRALVYRLSNINRQSSIRSLEVLKGASVTEQGVHVLFSFYSHLCFYDSIKAYFTGLCDNYLLC